MKNIFLAILTIFCLGLTPPNEDVSDHTRLAGIPRDKDIGYYIKVETIKSGLVIETIDSSYSVTSFELTYVPKRGDIYSKLILGNKVDTTYAPELSRVKMGDIVLIEKVIAVSKDGNRSKKFMGILMNIVDMAKIH